MIPFLFVATHTLSYAGQTVSIHCDDEACLRFLAFLFHDLPTICQQQEPVIALERARDQRAETYLVKKNGELVGGNRLGVGLAALVFDTVITVLLENNAGGLALHAGAVAHGDQVILLPGQSGAGKSTFTAWMVASGSAYLTDELVFFSSDHSGRMLPFTRPLCIKPGAVPVARKMIRDAGLAPMEDNEGMIIPHRAINPWFTPILAAPSLIVFPTYQQGSPSTVESVSTAKCIAMLMGCNVNGRNLAGHGFAEATRLAKSTQAFRVRYSYFDDLSTVLNPLLRSLGSK